MPKIDNSRDWDKLEDDYADKDTRNKISHKSKKHDIKEWKKVDNRLRKENNVKYVKSKRRISHKNNKHNIS